MQKSNARPFSNKLLNVIGNRAYEASVRSATDGLFSRKQNSVILPDGTIEDAAVIVAPMIAFVAAGELLSAGLRAEVVAGAAIWSVGSKDFDTLDHGVADRADPKSDAIRGNFHTWVVCNGWVMDFAARTLSQKFHRAHRMEPFSTGRMKWRQFPDTILHQLSNRMPDPLEHPHDWYRYEDRGPELLEEVTFEMRGELRAAEKWELQLR
ncbi:DUF2026 family protein [Thioclava sp.]|uniref:DUF2026 family protein n=1 Tax=Thioclava sp. TaxID=1933450 RepID=UPI003AA7B2EB